MKIELKRIKKYASSTLLVLAVVGSLVVAINEYTVNHNDNICLLTRIVGYQHQITKINTNEDNIKNGIFAAYSPKLYSLPEDCILDFDGKVCYKKEESHTAYDVNNDNQPYTVQDNMITIAPAYELIPNIEIVKTEVNPPRRIVVKTLRLK